MTTRWLGLVLAAGKGTRMRSDLAKVLHKIEGRTLLDHVLATAAGLPVEGVTVVVGHQAEEVRSAHGGRGLAFALQEPQLGTGHAVMAAASLLREGSDRLGEGAALLVLYGDVPLLSVETLLELMQRHEVDGAGVTVLSARLPDPTGYGRIVRDGDGAFLRITEDRDLRGEERGIDEINSGIYAFQLEPLLGALGELEADNAQNEYYLTDCLGILRARGHRVSVFCLEDPEEISGINTPEQLEEAAEVIRRRRGSPCAVCGILKERDDLRLDCREGMSILLAPSPWNAGHLWVAPHRHVTSFAALRSEEAGRLLAGAALAESWLEKAFHPQGFNEGYNSGRVGEHLVCHVIPRWVGDANFMPLIAGVNLLPEGLEDTRRRINEARGSLTEEIW